MSREISLRLRYKDGIANGAMAAFRLTLGRAGCRDCRIGGWRVGCQFSLRLRHKDGIADGAVSALGLALGGTGCRDCRIGHYFMTCGNRFLRLQDCIADGAFFPIGQAVFGAGCGLAGDGFWGVTRCRNHFRSDFIIAALSGALPALGAAVLRAGGGLCLSRHVLLVLQSGNFLIALSVAAAVFTKLVFRPPSFCAGGRFRPPRE